MHQIKLDGNTISKIVYVMAKPLPDLSDPHWDNHLVQLLVDTTVAIARLDERFSASFIASPWTQRASWSGYARALEAQGMEVEEIDIFGRECGVPLPFRAPIATVGDPLAALPAWRARFAGNARRHWAEDLGLTFDPPAGWGDRPALLRALELQARRTRSVGPSVWLDLPLLLQRLGITRALLPNLVAGDKALRLAPHDRGILPRFLRGLQAAAADGLTQLNALERDRQRAASVLADCLRPGKLAALAALLPLRPVLSPTRVAADLAVTISGAGKLLQRAESQGLVVEVRRRHNWRLYLPPDLAVRFGFIAPPRGRPPSPPPASKDLEAILAQFDAEMLKFEQVLDKPT